LWIAVKLVCSSCEATTESLSDASTDVISAEVAVVVSGVIGRSAVYSRYKKGPRAQVPCGVLIGGHVFSLLQLFCRFPQGVIRRFCRCKAFQEYFDIVTLSLLRRSLRFCVAALSNRLHSGVHSLCHGLPSLFFFCI
jgi:hypothetical protein